MTDFLVQRGKIEKPAAQLSATGSLGLSVSALSSAFAHTIHSSSYGLGPQAGTSNSLSTNDLGCNLELTNTGTVTLRGYDVAAAANEASYEVWEYTGQPGGANEFIVRHRQTVVFSTNSNTVDSSPIAGIGDINKCVAFVNGALLASGFNGNQFDRAQIGSKVVNNGVDDLVRLYRGDSSGSVEVQIVVVEFVGSNWSVWYYSDNELNYTTINAAENHIVADVGDWSKCFIYSTLISNNNDVVANGALVYPGSTTTEMKTWRASDFVEPRVYVIKNSDVNFNVQHIGPTTFSSDVAPQEFNIAISDVGVTGNAACMVQSLVDAGAGLHPEENLAAELTSPTNLRLWRNKSDAQAGRYSAQVIEFPAVSLPNGTGGSNGDFYYCPIDGAGRAATFDFVIDHAFDVVIKEHHPTNTDGHTSARYRIYVDTGSGFVLQDTVAVNQQLGGEAYNTISSLSGSSAGTLRITIDDAVNGNTTGSWLYVDEILVDITALDNPPIANDSTHTFDTSDGETVKIIDILANDTYEGPGALAIKEIIGHDLSGITVELSDVAGNAGNTHLKLTNPNLTVETGTVQYRATADGLDSNIGNERVIWQGKIESTDFPIENQNVTSTSVTQIGEAHFSGASSFIDVKVARPKPVGLTAGVDMSVSAEAKVTSVLGSPFDINKYLETQPGTAAPFTQVFDVNAEISVEGNIATLIPSGVSVNIDTAENYVDGLLGINTPTGQPFDFNQSIEFVDAPVTVNAAPASIDQIFDLSANQAYASPNGITVNITLNDIIVDAVLGEVAPNGKNADISFFLESFAGSVEPYGLNAGIDKTVIADISGLDLSVIGPSFDVDETVVINNKSIGVEKPVFGIDKTIEFESEIVTPVGQTYGIPETVFGKAKASIPVGKTAYVTDILIDDSPSHIIDDPYGYAKLYQTDGKYQLLDRQINI